MQFTCNWRIVRARRGGGVLYKGTQHVLQRIQRLPPSTSRPVLPDAILTIMQSLCLTRGHVCGRREGNEMVVMSCGQKVVVVVEWGMERNSFVMLVCQKSVSNERHSTSDKKKLDKDLLLILRLFVI